MNSKKTITIDVIFALAFIITSSSTYQFSFGKSDTKISAYSSTKDKTKSDTKSPDSYNANTVDTNANTVDTNANTVDTNANTVDTNDGKKQFDKFGKCLTMIADNNDFATEKEIKGCVMLVYDSDLSLSSTINTVDTNDDKKQFEQFGKCLSVIADNKDFATKKLNLVLW